MDQKQYSLFNNIGGWLAFAIAAFTYLSTMEPTTSLWDCGEFIAAAYKLQVVHPPGAPFFLMFNRLFAMLAPDPEQVAMMVNASSALMSAFTVLFLFWSTTYLSKKMIIKSDNDYDLSRVIAVLGSGLVGALAFTFSDTFWFSAVEGEVYAMSICFMALVFWLMLKWENRADLPGNLRWFILISFVIGLSIGVHLLSLLVIPSLAFIYYFKKTKEVNTRGIVITAIVSLIILGIVNKGVISYIPLIASRFELIFVNSFGLPFWSGIIFFILLMFGGLIYGIYWSHQKGKPYYHVAFSSFLVLMIAYSSYSMVVIRSSADTSLDMNNPETVFNLMSYLNREQYGDRPLLFGPDFTEEPTGYDDGAMQYRKGEEGYEEIGPRRIPKYRENSKSFFPRMGDTRGDRKRDYRKWADLNKGEKPTFADNIKFFFNYQLGHMYWRYFAWNFIGRQNGEQGFGHNFTEGNWLSGISFVDEGRVGPQDNLPYEQRMDPARNTLYFLPFILGLLGLIYQYRNDKYSNIYTLIFFVMTGIALIVYSNQPPIEPRERDYVLVGSFFAFSIWIGMSVLMIRQLLMKALKQGPVPSIAATAICLLLAPILMASEEWDDHDRSKRWVARDLARNYLAGCDKNAVLFTNGDNETYPIWYVQEVEGYRTDVRTVNMSLLNTDWYANHLRNDHYDSEGLGFSLSEKQIVQGTRDFQVFREAPQLGIKKSDFINLKEVVDFIASDNPRTKLRGMGTPLDFYPTRKFIVPADKDQVIKNGVIDKKYRSRIDEMRFTYPKKTMYKADLLVLDLIANNNWERPICFALTSGSSAYIGMQKYFRMDGLVYTLTPVRDKPDVDGQTGWVNSERLYDIMMNKWQWGNMDSEDLYIGSVMMRQCKNYRNIFNRLATVLINEGDNERAEKVLDRAFEVLPERNVPFGFLVFPLIQSYYQVEAHDKALKYAERMYEIISGDMEYYSALSGEKKRQVQEDIQRNLYILSNLQRLAKRAGQDEFVQKVNQTLDQYGGRRRPS